MKASFAQNAQHTEEQVNTRRIYFICINYHCSNLVGLLLESIDAQNDINSRCIIVNNSPQDRGLGQLSQRSDVILMQPGKNLGFGRGCNLALDYLEHNHPGAIAWLINPDAQLLPGAIKIVRTCLSTNTPPSLLGTRIQDTEGAIWFSRGLFDPKWGKVYQDAQANQDSISHKSQTYMNRVTTNERSSAISEELTEACDWLSGCSLIIDLTAITAKARFDDSFFLYYEDADLCLRMAKANVSSRVTKEVLVSHLVSGTMKNKPVGRYKHATFGKLYLLHRHASMIAVAINVIRFQIAAIVLTIKDPAQALGITLGIHAFFGWHAIELLPKYRIDAHKK